MKFSLVTPALPPRIDGIGDHSVCLAKELAKQHYVSLLAPVAEGHDPLPGVTVCPLFDPRRPESNWAIYDHVKSHQPDWLVLQYNPFSYGKRGFNLVLPRVMAAIKRDCPRTKIAMFAHERFVPVIDLKFAVMATWQRYQYRRLVRTADLVIIATSCWADELRKQLPQKPVKQLPVGSNMPRIEPVDRTAVRADLGIDDPTTVIGFFGTAHPSRMIDYVRVAAEGLSKRGREVVVLHIGPEPEKVRSMMGQVRLIADGALPPDEISKRLYAIDINTATMIDGVSSRRGSFFAGLQHGLATVGTSGINTDSYLHDLNGQAFILTPSGERDAYAQAVIALAEDRARADRLGAQARHYFDTELSWPVLTQKFEQMLGSFQ